MIKTIKHKRLKKLFQDDDTRGIAEEHIEKLLDILDRLDAATEIQDMNYPGSKLHQLKGKRQNVWAVNVSGNWRVTFRFSDGDAYDINYEDYH